MMPGIDMFRYPISAAFFNISSLVVGEITPVLLIALETVFLEKPNASAISCMVTLADMLNSPA